MKIVSLIIANMLLASCATHDPWTKTDTALLAVGGALKGMDYMQTKEIARDPRYYELNGLLGADPSQNKVDAYFAASFALQCLVAYLLPEKWRRVWLGAWIGVSGAAVGHNYRIGVRP